MPKGIPKNRATNHQLHVVRGGKRNILDIDKDTWYAVSEIAKGRTYQEIADELNAKNPNYNLTRFSVANDVERALVEWKKQNMENIDAYIAKDLMRIENIEKVVMEDYEKSKTLRPSEYAVLMKRGMTIEEIDEMYAERKLGGNPMYIETLLHLQMQRMRLLGLDKGRDVAQQTIINYDFRGARLDELLKVADALQDAKKQSIDEQ